MAESGTTADIHVSVRQIMQQSLVSRWYEMRARSSQSLLSSDWTLASKMVGSGGRWGRRLSLTRTPAIFPLFRRRFSVHRSDRTKELTGYSRGGGVCFFINNMWCDERNLHSIKAFCSPDLEFHMLLCRPFWLRREFTAIIITAVYILPQANTDQALKELYGNISEQETVYPDAAFIVTGEL